MTLKELLDVAKSELQGVSTLQNPDIRLEQVEHKKDARVWDVVVSYLVENTNKPVKVNSIIPLPASDFRYYRIYKRLKINENKEVEGLYMYDKQQL